MPIKKPLAQVAKQPATDSAVGSYVQYDDEGQVILAVVTGFKKDKLSILTMRGRELDLARQRLYFLPGRQEVTASTTSARVEALTRLAQEIEHSAGAQNVEELWGFVHEEEKPYTVSELCTLYMGKDTCVEHAGLRVALIRDKTHFKRDKDAFEPRPKHVVEDLKRAEEVKRKKKEARDAALDFLERRVDDTALLVPPELRDVIHLVEEVAATALHTDPARQKEAREFVHVAAERLAVPESLSIEKRAFELLRKTSFFDEHSNLAFVRHQIPATFSADAINEAHVVAAHIQSERGDVLQEQGGFRRDLSRVRAFTIDDTSTLDMDDALSLERLPEGWELGIHITDLTHAIAPGTKLDREARRRATSIYCADRTVNMLPECLSDDALSLRVGVPRPCISVMIRLTDEFSIVSHEVCASVIVVSERYNYDQVDELLEQGDMALLQLHDIAAACEERRIRQGAVRVQKREVVPVYEKGQVILQEIHEDSPARLLVSEMMVLANNLMAQFAHQNRIPVMYRGQERAEEDHNDRSHGEEAPEGPAKDFSTRTRLKKSSVSFEPQYHASLGLNAYIQATSPIRRYLDLCHQRQFISFLRKGAPEMTQAEFEQVAAEIEVPLQAANLASRETKRYWLLRYLEQRPRNQPIEGTVVRTDLKSPLVELDEVYITALARLQTKPTLGQRVSLKITGIDPHYDYLRLS